MPNTPNKPGGGGSQQQPKPGSGNPKPGQGGQQGGGSRPSD